MREKGKVVNEKCAKIQNMGTYWYIEDPDSDEGLYPVFEDDYIAALLGIAKKNGIKITNKMIFEEVKKK